MRLLATELTLAAALVIHVPTSFADWCACKRPPGGRTECELDQMAYCEVENDGNVECVGSCTSRSSVEGDKLAALIASRIVGEEVSVERLFKEAKLFRDTLASFVNEFDGQGIYWIDRKRSFGLPSWALEQLEATIEKLEQ